MMSSTITNSPKKSSGLDILHRASAFQESHSLSFDLGMAAIIGFLYALYLFGPIPLNPFNITWLRGDPVTHYIGWALFRQDHQLHWPITYTERVGYPIGDSIALMDVNPLFAVLLKPLSTLLPAHFQYFCIEAILACSLQYLFALRLFRLLLDRNVFAILLSSLYFLMAPPIALRLTAHYALSNQWLLTAALFIFALTQREPGIARRHFQLLAIAIAALSISINPYLAFQVLVIMTATVCAQCWQRRLTVPAAVGTLGALIVTSIAFAYAFGFVIPGGQGYTAGGYRYYSMNLLAPFDPIVYGSLLLRPLPFFAGGQYEGYNYLGAGVILLAGIVTALILLRRAIMPKPRWSAITPLMLACLLLMLMALSTRITFGAKILIDLDPHERLTPYLSILRSSGRLFWTPYYTLLAAVLAAPYCFLSRKAANILLAVALAVQVIDLEPLHRWVHSQVNQSFTTPLQSPVWFKLGSRYDNLIVLPAWQCGPNASPGGNDGYAVFGMLAAEEHMRINSYFTGRQTSANLAFHCGKAIADVIHGPLSPTSVYVVTPTIAATLVGANSAKCHNLDGFILCSAKDDFGLPANVWESPMKSWIRHQVEVILRRDPTDAELANWSRVDQRARSNADVVTELMTSPEFNNNVLARFCGYMHTHGHWPTLTEWETESFPIVRREGDGANCSLGERNRAVVYLLYFALLGREPDRFGLRGWSEALGRTSLANVIAGLMESPEYKARHL